MISSNIQAARKSAGMTQKELALALEVTQKDISRWESGVRTPGAENIVKLCRTLNVSADVLLDTGIQK